MRNVNLRLFYFLTVFTSTKTCWHLWLLNYDFILRVFLYFSFLWIFINRSDSSNSLHYTFIILLLNSCHSSTDWKNYNEKSNYCYYYSKNADRHMHVLIILSFYLLSVLGGIILYIALMCNVYVILTKNFQCKWISINKYWYMI